MQEEKQRIYLVRRGTRYLLAATFMRFQEYYESPEFKGRVFSWEEFMDWYAETYGNFTYFEDWTGFNIPSWVLRPFREGRFNPLTTKEGLLLSALKGVPEPFYIIGVSTEKEQEHGTWALDHEFVHGLFYTTPAYGEVVVQCLKSSDTSKVEEALRERGYHPSVFHDETNAFVLTGLGGLTKNGVNEEDIRELKEILSEIFFNHFGYRIEQQKPEFILSKVHQLQL